eukprot:CAMPEP_0181033514 /NCGR_PEP_ID=MMETSP1070-20121207/7294_1 /TAXON_ID=265543 /ORGANISM="Minutocellus polymorphus, Strain NH13" /LENGTH=1205 /DNA_ID=CAMNT_0023110939 /DNA_START=108 /DNA_END=3725 /DNA_ORIENTATION=+
MVRPTRRTALAVSAAAAAAASAAVAISASCNSVEAFQPPPVVGPQHRRFRPTCDNAQVPRRSDAPSLPQPHSVYLSSQHGAARQSINKRRTSSSPLAVSASPSLDDSDSETNGSTNTNGNGNTNNISSADSLQSVQGRALTTAETALSTLSNAADQVVKTAVSVSDDNSAYVDDYEVEQRELAARRAAAVQEAARRRSQYEITVPLASSSSTSFGSTVAAPAQKIMVGLTLRQFTADGRISAAALDLDNTASLLPNLTTEEEMDPTVREGGGSVEILSAMLEPPKAGAVVGDGTKEARGGVIVSSVVRDGAAWEAGVRPGDRILATSATVGQKMWPKTTLDGIRSAISSRRVMSSSIKIQLQRGAGGTTRAAAAAPTAAASSAATAAASSATATTSTTATDDSLVTEFELRLSRPLGINAEDGPDGYVVVTGLNPDGTNGANDLSSVQIGDRIVAVDSSLGSQMWPVSSVAGLVSACTSRLPKQTVSLRFERVSSTTTTTAASSATTSSTSHPSVADSTPSVTDSADAAKARQVLLSRCRDVLVKYTQQYKDGDIANVALLTVAEKIVSALADSSVSPDAATLNLLMNVYVANGRADDAVRIFEASTGVCPDGSTRPPAETSVIASKTKEGYRIMPSLEALGPYTATALLRAHSMKKDGVAARRVLAAMEGQEGLVVGGVRAASWPRGESDGSDKGNANAKPDNWITDTRCYNIVLAAASKMRSNAGLQIASELFDTMLDPKASKKEWADSAEAQAAPFRDAASYNSMIAGYARTGRMQDALDMFRSMQSCGLEPDKFTYTSLIKASVESGDVDGGKSILDDMESKGIEADVFAYNTVIKGLCDRFRWYEAKELVSEMEWNGVTPDSYTYGMLMNGLIKADKPGPALTLFETACADPRTVDVAQNVQIYTTAVTAASMTGDHARALGLVSRMVSAGIKPNLKTFTSLMGGCLSSGKTSYALDIFGKISEHDGLSLELGIRAFCDSGDFASATSILTEQRDGRREMSGKQVMTSYNYIIEAALRQRKFDVARTTFTELLDSGYIPSKMTLRTIPEALSLVPRKGQTREKVTDDNREESEAAFDFMLFVMDLMDQRKLPVAGSFYAAVLFEGSRSGGVRRDVASLIAESKLSLEGGTLIDVSDTIECAEEEICLGWQDVFENYADYEGKGIPLPTVRVNTDGKSIRSVLAAEQRVTFGRRRPKRAAV